MNRREVLEAAIKCVCQDRQDTHGNPENTFAMIADLWEIYICHKHNIEFSLAPEDVCVMMSLFKAARFALGKHSDDNSIDGAGYFALANELRSDAENRPAQSLSKALKLGAPYVDIKNRDALDTCDGR